MVVSWFVIVCACWGSKAAARSFCFRSKRGEKRLGSSPLCGYVVMGKQVPLRRGKLFRRNRRFRERRAGRFSRLRTGTGALPLYPTRASAALDLVRAIGP